MVLSSEGMELFSDQEGDGLERGLAFAARLVSELCLTEGDEFVPEIHVETMRGTLSITFSPYVEGETPEERAASLSYLVSYSRKLNGEFDVG